MSEQTPTSDLEAALAATAELNEQDALLLALATGEIVLPQMAQGTSEDDLTLPFIERLGTRYALAFSSRQRLDESGLDFHGVYTLRGDRLGEAWPQHENVWLAIDPGSEHAATLPPKSVRSLASLVS